MKATPRNLRDFRNAVQIGLDWATVHALWHEFKFGHFHGYWAEDFHEWIGSHHKEYA